MVYDVKVNGVSLNTPSCGVDVFEGRRSIPQRRSTDVSIPGRAGNYVHVSTFEPSNFSIGMWVLPNDPGTAPTFAGLEANIDRIVKLFLKRKVRIEWQRPDNTWVWCDAIVNAVLTPDVNYRDMQARVTVVLENPDSFWKASSVTTFTSSSFGSAVFPAPLDGMTGVEQFGVLRINGPISNPTVTVGEHKFTWTGTIAQGQWVEFNNLTLRAANNAGNSIAPFVTQTHRQFFEYAAGDTITVSGGATNQYSSWTLTATKNYA